MQMGKESHFSAVSSVAKPSIEVMTSQGIIKSCIYYTQKNETPHINCSAQKIYLSVLTEITFKT